MENNYKVYIHQLRTDGRVYVGQTKMNLDERSGHNGGRYKNCIKFYNAIQLYGWENFEHIIIKDNLTLEEANILEAQLIRQYDSIENGFNLVPGGRNHTWNEEQRKQMSLRNLGEKNPNYGKPRSPETRRRIGEKNKISQLGKTHSEQTKKKMSDSHKQYRPIRCIETNKIYDYPLDAARELNKKNSGHILEVCYGKRKTAYGYHWEFINKENNNYE